MHLTAGLLGLELGGKPAGLYSQPQAPSQRLSSLLLSAQPLHSLLVIDWLPLLTPSIPSLRWFLLSLQDLVA